MKGFLPISLKPNYDTDSLLPALNASRMIKDHDEIDLIRKAIKVSSLAHRTVMHHITSMKSEAEVYGLFMDVCIAHGANWQAYPPIVASGTNASILHYTDNNMPLQGKSLLCLDAGCEWECHSSDITCVFSDTRLYLSKLTLRCQIPAKLGYVPRICNADLESFLSSRTLPLEANGWPSKEVAATYAIVEEMQEKCIAMLGPGVRYLDAVYLSESIAVEGLMRLGILREGNVEELLKSRVVKAFYPHGLGHHMGLDVHDVSLQPILSVRTGKEQSNVNYCEKSLLRPTDEVLTACWAGTVLLEPGMVITVEPGICMFEQQLSNIEKLI